MPSPRCRVACYTPVPTGTWQALSQTSMRPRLYASPLHEHLRPRLRPPSRRAKPSLLFCMPSLSCRSSFTLFLNLRRDAGITMRGQYAHTCMPCTQCMKIALQRPLERRWVKLLRILSPHAELSSTSKTSAALTALFCLLRATAVLFCLLRFPAGPDSGSRGLGGRLRADANCHSPSPGGEKGDICGEVLIGDNGDALVGELSGVCWIELARLRSVMSPGTDGS
jgi:hypothetical protein